VTTVTPRGLRIAMIGQRGLPATYGGVERHVEELGARLAEMGHEVIVYCRPNYSTERLATYRGTRLVYLDTPERKHLEAIVHSASATRAAMHADVDIVHYHALGPGLVTPIPRFFSKAKVVQTVHGLDHQRAKWGRVASSVLRLGGWLSARVPDATIVVSHALQEHYRLTYGRHTTYMCNGVDVPAVEDYDGDVLGELGVEPGKYVLYVGRLVPEKAPDLLLRAFARLDRDDVRLVLAGPTSFTEHFVDDLREVAARDPRVVMPGNVLRGPLSQLYANAALFVLPSDVEGMPLTLLEAASHGAPVLASDIPPHREMIGDERPGRRMFRQGNEDDLLAKIGETLDGGDVERQGARKALTQVHDAYNWDRTAAELAALYESLVGRSGSNPPTSHLESDELTTGGGATVASHYEEAV
jgi:glycosyltransferase involved in cell wall biosynthesis